MTKTKPPAMNSLARLRLLYLASPTLPIGAYAYSQGQEFAVDEEWLKSDDSLYQWMYGLLRHALGQLDLPVLQRLYDARAEEDWQALNHWNAYLIACRETRELLLEDEQLGLALGRLLESHGVASILEKLEPPHSFVSVFVIAGFEWQIDQQSLSEAYVWSWLENQVAAATKSIPLGQTKAQCLLMRLLETVPDILETSQSVEDEDLGLSAPGLAMASSLHERQYSRLFRS
jgi:urease accessory protein